VEQFMRDDEVLEMAVLVDKIARERNDSSRRISWMRMTLGLTRSFTAQARAWRRSSRDLVDALRWVWKHHAHPQRPVDKDKS
jgi:hypothetical protein